MRQSLGKYCAGIFFASLLSASTACADQEETETMTNTLSITNFVGTLDVTNTSSSELDLPGLQNALFGIAQVNVDETHATITITGQETRTPRNCIRSNGEVLMQFDDEPMTNLADLPTVKIAVPSSYDIQINMNAGNANLADFRSVTLNLGRCAALQLQNVQEKLAGTIASGSSFSIASVGTNDSAASVDLSLARAARGTIGTLNANLHAKLESAARLSIESGESASADIELGRAARLTHKGGIGSLKLNADRASRMLLSRLYGDLDASELSKRALTIESRSAQ